MKRAAGADVPAVCFLRETLKMGRGLFDAYDYLIYTNAKINPELLAKPAANP